MNYSSEREREREREKLTWPETDSHG